MILQVVSLWTIVARGKIDYAFSISRDAEGNGDGYTDWMKVAAGSVRGTDSLDDIQ